jgi:hypothetical protein
MTEGIVRLSPPGVRAYLDEVAAGLAGPRRHRERILAELGDGLDEAVADHAAAGLDPVAAARAAIDGFGSSREVADACIGELATASARRVLGWFVVTGPLVGVWWLLLLHPRPWRGGLVALIAAIPVIPLVAVALVTAAGTFATTGRLMRWLPEAGAQRALAAAATVAVLVIGGDTAVIAGYLGSGSRPGLLAAVAMIASVIRIGCGVGAVWHVTALRHRVDEGAARPAGRPTPAR